MARKVPHNKGVPQQPKKRGSVVPGMPDRQGDVYDDTKLDDEYDPGAYLGDQYIMLGDEHPEGPWK